jgi:hypothetical protein
MVNNTGEQQMTKNSELFVVGAEVEYEANTKYDVKYGRSRLVSIERTRTFVTYNFESLGGKNPGSSYWWKMRIEYGVDTAAKLAKVMKIAKQATAASRKKVIDKLQADYKKREAKYQENLAGNDVRPGDIVTVITADDEYDFKVCEVDYKQCKLKGFRTTTSYTRVGSRMGWVRYEHAGVTIKMKQKQGFNVELDACYNAHKAEAADAGAKRADTRARRKELRDRFGW